MIFLEGEEEGAVGDKGEEGRKGCCVEWEEEGVDLEGDLMGDSGNEKPIDSETTECEREREVGGTQGKE